MEGRKRIMVWFRSDFRLRDHAPLAKAAENGYEVIPVVCCDVEKWNQTAFGIGRMSAFRAQFWIESVSDLRQNIRTQGGELIVIKGNPVHVLPLLAKKLEVSSVWAHKGIATEEVQEEVQVEKALQKDSKALKLFWGNALYQPNDLPMPITALPEMFTRFRNQVEKYAKVRSEYAVLENKWLNVCVNENERELTLHALTGWEAPSTDKRREIVFEGGETAAWARLHHYLEGSHAIATYKETRNGLLGMEYSTKFSPWLAHGCISPIAIYHAIKQYEQKHVANESTYWVIFELLWRDYFRFIALKHGNNLFLPGGIKQENNTVPPFNPALFQQWCTGTTGVPFVDANMQELLSTGFMSNRGRQNVASFLVHDLKIDWRRGAAWFEYCLIDYDVHSNWGNWNYVAGVGNDPRENRYFNIAAQSARYDAKGLYVEHWLGKDIALP